MRIRCRVGIHDWKYKMNGKISPIDYSENEGSTRVCTSCNRTETLSVHCLGLNPPRYINNWTFTVGEIATLGDSIKLKLSKIAKEYASKEIVYVTPGDEYCDANGVDAYLNASYSATDIEVGIYTDKDKMLASIFHEIGHDMIKGDFNTKYYNKLKTYKMPVENEAWVRGFELAEENGFEFSDEVFDWASECIMSYYDSK